MHSVAPRETRGQLLSLATPVDRTLYFDFLPLRGPRVRDHHVRLQLFTVPGQVYFNATRKLVLTGADGVVFVADSQPERQDANLESLENLVANFAEQGRAIDGVPLVLQYNKQDLPRALRPESMEPTLGARVPGRSSFGTVATTGQGVLEALDRLVAQVLDDLERRGIFGGDGAPSSPTEPALLAAWLGVASARWLAFRGAVRRAGSGAPLAPRDAWVALFVALDLALTLELA